MVNPVHKSVSGKPTFPRHTVKIGSLSLTTGFPAVIVYVKQCHKWHRAFAHFVRTNGLNVALRNEQGERFLSPEVPDMGKCYAARDSDMKPINGRLSHSDAVSTCDEGGAWEVVATGDTLEALRELTGDPATGLEGHKCVSHWHPVVNCSVHWSGRGMGAEKVRKVTPKQDPEALEYVGAFIKKQEVLKERGQKWRDADSQAKQWVDMEAFKLPADQKPTKEQCEQLAAAAREYLLQYGELPGSL